MDKTSRRRKDTGRAPGGFIALPWSVLDCPAYLKLSMHARALLLEVARQYGKSNNGRLLMSRAFMQERGWTSVDMLTKAKRELLEGGFVFQTVQGKRPNKASWFAITWQPLDKHPGFDPGAAEAFRKLAYLDGAPLPKTKPTREELYRKWDGEKNAVLRPSHGTEKPPIGPCGGTGAVLAGPWGGPMEAVSPPLSVPSHGHL